MRARFALVALATALTLSGCSLFGGSDDDISGFWEGSAVFSVDTVLVDQNYRIKGDYEFRFMFDLTQEDGLVEGRIRAIRSGEIVDREAGFLADTTRYFDGMVTNDDFAGGTYIDPELELDVVDGPYSEDLWTFNVVGSRAESENFILHERTFIRQIDGQEFTFAVRSDEPFSMRRMDRPDAMEAKAKASGAQRDAFRPAPEPRRQRSEQ